MPNVSVIIPVYNTEKYLEKCLNSVFNQSLDDIEVIVVNDGSTDRSEEIIQEFIKNYKNLIYISKKNGGQGSARNLALKVCNGRYIGFVDSDDLINENMYKNMYEKAILNDLDLVICKFKDLKYINYLYDENKIYDKEHIIKDFLINENIKSTLTNQLIKREIFFKSNNIKFPENMVYEDIETSLNVITHCSRIGFVNKEFYEYINRLESTTHSLNIKKIEDYFKGIYMVKELLIRENMYFKFCNEYKYYFTRMHMNMYYSFLRIDKLLMENEKRYLIQLFYNKINEIKIKNIVRNKYFYADKKLMIKYLLFRMKILKIITIGKDMIFGSIHKIEITNKEYK